MALVYSAEIRPSKIELITDWAPTQPWFEGDAAAGFTNVAAYRFDDPEGEVGIETLLVRVGDGPLLQVPLTYRGAPLDGADAWLITTMEHSVLGNRWVYDGTGDPAYLAAVATAALTGGRQADVMAENGGELTRRDPTAVVAGSGTRSEPVDPPAIGSVSTRHEDGTTVVDAGALTISVPRVIDGGAAGAAATVTVTAASDGDGAAVLRGTWPDQPNPRTLAVVVAR
ncbi:CG0192-related protein [Leifsonia sp. A12D58]|uniref:CG0192-related protein n=1 Tax=Leifsonia sp. A12D58 TaxID=3397674 RepID=UPI0039E1B817